MGGRVGRRRGAIDRVRRSWWGSGVAVGALVAPLALAAPVPVAAPAPGAPKVDIGTPVAGIHPAAVANRSPHSSTVKFTPTRVSWPAATTGSATLSAPGANVSAHSSATTRAATGTGSVGARGYAAGTPVWGQTLAPSSGSYQGPTKLSVSVLDHAAATAAGVTGVLFTATPTAGGKGTVRVGLDYASFDQAYGGDFGARLRLVRMPACALTTPKVPACRMQTPLSSVNDAASNSVSASLTLSSQTTSTSTRSALSSAAVAPSAMVLAATSTPATGDGGGAGGTFSATSLKASGSWSAGGSSGSFTYSYPISVPPAASSLVPTVGLNYDSGSVDGQTAASQSQADWAGDGWSTPENFVEQSFVPCSDSPEGSASPQATGDMCYDGPILTLSLNGSTSSLVCASNCTSGSAVWKPVSDNGEVVTHHVSTSNGTGTYNTDYWTVTDRDGTTFSFGLNQLPGWSSGKATTNSVQSEPVYAAHSGDPCYNATWSSSWCTMAYRWNLDYVKDLHGNAMAYYYKQDSNAYARNDNTSSATAYVRDSHLDHIDYGFSDGGAYGTIPDKVVFTTADRCVSGTCDPLNSTNAGNWPDVPYDLNCATGSACQVAGPSFWSTVRLSGISTEQYNGTGYTPVDSWALGETIPANPSGDTTNPTLWLNSITHTGSDTSAGGAAVTLPAVTFTPVQLTNRADTSTGLPPLSRNRIASVTTETGEVISVGYELTKACTAPITLTPSTNTSSCFPVYWTPTGYTAPILDWFNKYTVAQVTQADLQNTGSSTIVTKYNYVTGAAWHYDDNEVVQPKYRTYGQFRGYGDVQTFTGTGAVTESESTYYRGMSNDNNSTAVTLTDSQGGAHDDTNQLAGQVLESTQYNYSGGPILSSTINSYWISAPTATRTRSGLPALTANATGQIETWNRTALTDGGTTTWRKTETDTSYDATITDPTFGLPTIVYQHGDLSLTGNNQQRCTVTTYAPANATANLVGLTAEVESDADPCGGANPAGSTAPTAAQTNALTAPSSVSRPADVVSDTRTFYDLQPLGSTTEPTTAPVWPQAAPTYGDVSEGQVATGYANGAFTYQVKSAATFDSYGRNIAGWDALGHKSQTTYTMTNGVTTAATVTNPLNQSISTRLDPYRALPLTVTDANNIASTAQYDGLGRTIAVWKYGRATTTPADATYSYTVSNSAPTAVTTQTRNDANGYATSTVLYDALLRQRQTQAPTPQGGRLINDTFYDTHGWAFKKNTDYWDQTGTPNATLMSVADSAVGNFDQDVIAFDGAGRPVQDQSYNQGQLVTTSYNAYYGDKSVTVPPVGTDGKIVGTPTATITDALGRTTELDQYTTAPTVNSSTTNGITTVTLTGGTTQATDYLFDNVGEQTDVKDPLTGADWNTSYNLLGQAVAKNDPDAGATTAIAYDADGNLLQSTDARGKTISYTYDALGRKTGEYDAPTALQSTSNQLDSWVYDNANNVTGVANPVGKLTTATAYVSGNAYTTQARGFNAFGESTGEVITLPTSEGALGTSYTFTHTYSTGVGLPYRDIYPASPGGGALPAETVTHGFTQVSGMDMVTGLSSALGSYQINTTFDAYGRLTQAILGANGTSAYLDNRYDPHTGRLSDSQLINNAVSSTIPIDETAYNYDAVGNPTGQTETRNGTQAETQCYRYDQLDRLTQAWTATDQCATAPASGNSSMVGDGVPGGAYWTSWQYNPDGTRKSETDHNLTGATDTATNYTYGGQATGCPAAAGAHTLQTAATTGPSGSTTNTYCYDPAGNTTQRNTTANGQQSLSWYDQGQLQAVTTASGGVSYIYGPDGSLLLQKDATTKTNTLYLPGEQLVLNTNTNALTGTRFYGLSGGAQAVRTGGTTNYSFQLTDQHNTSTLTLNNTLTSPVWRQQTPYGAPRGTAPASWPDNHGFLNKPQDTTTGLTDIGARWYDPTTGTFQSLDPVLEATSPQQLAGYTYAADNPTAQSDPTGLDPCQYGGCSGGIDGVYAGSGIAPPPGSYNGIMNLTPAQIAAAEKKNADTNRKRLQAEISALQQAHKQLLKLQADATYCNSMAGADKQSCMEMALAGVLDGARGHFTWTDLFIALGIAAGALVCQAPGIDAVCAAAADMATTGTTMTFDAELAMGGGLVTGGIGAGGGAYFAARVSEALGLDQKLIEEDTTELNSLSCAANSFAAATPVLMADGTSKPIDQIKVGDKIANNQPGADAGTEDQAHTVTAIHVTYTDRDYTDVTVDTGHGPATITGTAHHPYWDATTRAWTDADQLHAGDRLQTTDGNTVTVLSLRDYVTTAVTYNLTVDGLHTYYVLAGDTPVLVHNSNCDIIAGPNLGTLSVTAASPSASEVGAAEYLASQGNDVVLRDPVGARGTATSDLLVNGEQWDVYTPTTGNVSRIVSAVASKGSQVQGGGVIIDLSQSSVTADQLANIQARIAGTGARVGQIVVMP